MKGTLGSCIADDKWLQAAAPAGASPALQNGSLVPDIRTMSGRSPCTPGSVQGMSEIAFMFCTPRRVLMRCAAAAGHRASTSGLANGNGGDVVIAAEALPQAGGASPLYVSNSLKQARLLHATCLCVPMSQGRCAACVIGGDVTSLHITLLQLQGKVLSAD